MRVSGSAELVRRSDKWWRYGLQPVQARSALFLKTAMNRGAHAPSTG
jgi:hypothetical protein